MTCARTCVRCGAPLDGRRAQARYCSAACRSAARHAARSAPVPPNPGPTLDRGAETVHKRAQGVAATLGAQAADVAARLDRVEARLDDLLPLLRTVEARYVVRAILAALREDEDGTP